MQIEKIKAPPVLHIKRVAAYARVSVTELEHSLTAQMDYYENLIRANPEWRFAGIYADNGISGTSTKRAEFQRLIKDCEAGLVDIILVKSISRFARNTVDMLNTIRHLKDIGVEVRFEREHINTLSGDGELMLTLLASFAQAESESISRNIKWSIKKGFENGEPNTGLRCFGYNWENKKLVINEEEAKWVRYIFDSFISGMSIKSIAKSMADVKTIRTTMNRTTVRYILTSKTYTGVLVLQKYYSPRLKKAKRNTGQVDMYEVLDNHEAIISKETFEKAQTMLANTKYERTFFAGLVKCGKCGHACVRQVQKSNYHNIECTHRKEKKCDLLPIKEEALKKLTDGMDIESITLFDEHIDIRAGGRHICKERSFSDVKKSDPLAGRVFCGKCGSKLRKVKKLQKWVCYKCSVITYEELTNAAKETVGNEIVCYKTIDKVTVYEDRIIFKTKEGERIWGRL